VNTHRFGRKLKLPSTVAIKHQIRRLMFIEMETEERARVEAVRRQMCEKARLAEGRADSTWMPSRPAG
jgi:hypothetical protein